MGIEEEIGGSVVYSETRFVSLESVVDTMVDAGCELSGGGVLGIAAVEITEGDKSK